MEHPFFPTTTTRAEALRWLTIAEKLLSARDLMGSKSFASRARDSDPTLTPADQILAVADTLLAGDRRIGNNQHDWYAVLRLTQQQGRDSELVAAQYRNLALILNPQKNKFPFAEQAFRLVVDAWSVLSNPSGKSMYDKELAFFQQPQQQQQQKQQRRPDPFSNPTPSMQQNFMFFGGNSSTGVAHPSQPQSGAHFPQVQVHASTQVDPVGDGSTREPQNFMSFTSGSNLVFGSASKMNNEPVNKQVQESSPTLAGNVAAAARGSTQEQVNKHHEQPQQNYSNAGNNKTPHHANMREDVGEGIEDEENAIDGQEERVNAPANDDNGSTFWTACPYCYYMYEYPMVYADCTLRCQNCKRAFQGVVVSSPPPIVDGKEGYFCCWGFMPMGFSVENWEKNKGAASSWAPFSPMFTCPQAPNGNNNPTKRAGGRSSAPRVYVDDDEVFVEVSDSSGSDDDWGNAVQKKNKKAKNVKGKGASGTPSKSAKKAQVDKGKNVNVQDGVVPPPEVEVPIKAASVESSKKGVAASGRRQPGRVAKNFGKLDLNVEFSNEAEEPAATTNQGSGPSRGKDDNIEGEDGNIEGIGFFEGLDEFLSSLPILNVVGDEKVVK